MAQIYLKGQKNIIELTTAEAEKIKKQWAKYLLERKNKPVNLGTIVTTLAEIKAISLDTESKEDKVYSVGELLEFDKELDKYRQWGVCPLTNQKKKYLSKEGEFRYLQDKGIMSPRRAIYANKFDQYRECENKIKELSEYKCKKEYIVKKQLEELDKYDFLWKN